MPPVERSITVSAPYFTASFSFFTSSADRGVRGGTDVGVHLALAGTDPYRSKLVWLMLAGMIIRPRQPPPSLATRADLRFATWAIFGHHALTGVASERHWPYGTQLQARMICGATDSGVDIWP